MTIRPSKAAAAETRFTGASARARTAALLTGTALGCTLMVGVPPALADNECGPAGATVTCASGTYSNGVRYATLTEALALNIPVGAVINTTGVDKPGISVSGGAFDTSIVQRGSLTTKGDSSPGIVVRSSSGAIAIDAGSVTTSGGYDFDFELPSEGITAYSTSGAISVAAQTINVSGQYASALYVQTGVNADINITTGQTISTAVDSVAFGVAGGRNITINSGSISAQSQGISVSAIRNSVPIAGRVTINSDTMNIGGSGPGGAIGVSAATKDVVIDSGTITTTGARVSGISVTGATVDVTSDVLSTTGAGISAISTVGSVTLHAGETSSVADGARAIYVKSAAAANVTTTGTTTSAGDNTRGIFIDTSAGSGSINLTTATTGSTGLSAPAIFANSASGAIIINAGTTTAAGGFDGAGSGDTADAINAYSTTGSITIASQNASSAGQYTSAIGAISTAGGAVNINSALAASSGQEGVVVTAVSRAAGGTATIVSGTVNDTGRGNGGVSATASDAVSVTSGTLVSTGLSLVRNANALAFGSGVGGSSTTKGVTVDSGSVSSVGDRYTGVYATATGASGSATITSGSVTNTGAGATGISGRASGAVTITSGTVRNTGGVSTQGTSTVAGVGISAISTAGAVVVNATDTSVNAAGAKAIFASGQTGLTLNIGTATSSGAEVGTDDLIAVYGQTASGPTTATFTGATSAANGFGAWLNTSGAGPVNVTVASTGSVSGLRGGLKVDTGTGAITVTNFGRIEATGTVFDARTQSALDIGGNAGAAGSVVNNHGSIISRLTATGPATAISFSDLDSNDTLNLYTGSNIVGSVGMFGGTDTVNLFGTGLTKTTTQVVGNIFGSEVLNVATGYWTQTGEVEATSVNIVSGATLDIGFVPTSGVFSAITNNGTLAFSLTDALTYSGTISGTGKVVKLGTNALTLSGANTYSGGTTVGTGTLILTSDLTSNTVVNSGATLQIGTGGTTGSLIGDLVANGTVIFDRSDNYLLAGALSGNGSLIKRGSGLLTLDGVYAFTGTTSILGGTLKITQLAAGSELELGNGATVDLSGGQQTVGALSGGTGSTVNIEDATLTVSQTGVGTTNTFAGSLTGDGALIVDGTGNFVLSGNNTYTGPTSVNGGLLTVNGSINSPTTVTDGGTLGGSGQINGLVSITSGGTLAPGNSPGTLNIAGPLTLASGSTLAIEVDPTLAINHDQVNVTGTATIVDGAKLQVKPLGTIGNYARTQGYTILNATGGVTGRFAAGDISTTMALLTPTLSYTSNAVTLRLLRNDITFNSLAVGSNQSAVATAAEASGIGAAAYEALVTQSATGAQAGYDSLSGEAFGSTGSLLLNQSRHQREALLARAGSAEGRGAWFHVLNATNRIEATAISGRARDEETGIAGGADTTAGAWTVGLSLSYRQSDIEVASRGSQSDVDTFSGSLYAGTDFGGLRVGGGFDYARHEVDSTRAILFPGVSQKATGSYDAETQQVFVEAAYPMTLGGAAFEPFGSIAGVKFESDAFSETGGNLALNVAGEDRRVVLTDLGARISGSVDAGDIAVYPKLSLAWRHASGDIEGTSTAAFGTTPFTVRGGDLAEDSAVIDAGVGIDLGRNGKAWLSYSGVLADESTSNSVMLGASFSF